jgi:hypothetical protein
MNRPFLNVDSGGTLLFDGLAAVCWFVNMRSTMNTVRITNISPGELYTFVFAQDAAGGHTITWPNNCINAAPIKTQPYAITVQNFVGHTGTTLYANIPSTGRV